MSALPPDPIPRKPEARAQSQPMRLPRKPMPQADSLRIQAEKGGGRLTTCRQEKLSNFRQEFEAIAQSFDTLCPNVRPQPEKPAGKTGFQARLWQGCRAAAAVLKKACKPSPPPLTEEQAFLSAQQALNQKNRSLMELSIRLNKLLVRIDRQREEVEFIQSRLTHIQSEIDVCTQEPETVTDAQLSKETVAQYLQKLQKDQRNEKARLAQEALLLKKLEPLKVNGAALLGELMPEIALTRTKLEEADHTHRLNRRAKELEAAVGDHQRLLEDFQKKANQYQPIQARIQAGESPNDKMRQSYQAVLQAMRDLVLLQRQIEAALKILNQEESAQAERFTKEMDRLTDMAKTEPAVRPHLKDREDSRTLEAQRHQEFKNLEEQALSIIKPLNAEAEATFRTFQNTLRPFLK